MGPAEGATAAEAGGSALWARYLAFVQEPAPMLASVLGHGRFAGLSGGDLHVFFTTPLYADLFRDKGAEASRLAGECFGRPMRVVVVDPKAAEAGAESEAARGRRAPAPAGESDRDRALRKEALEHDSVNEAVRILGGEIKEIKTLGG